MLYWAVFRFRQFGRMIRSAGIVLLLTAIVITAGLWFQLLGLLADLNSAQTAVLSFVLTGWLHLKRSDRRFLEKGSSPVQVFCAVDYCLLLLPLTGIFFILGAKFAALAVLSGLLWALLPPGLLHRENHAISRRLIPLIPIKAIEWRYIFRKQWPLVFIGIGLFFGTFWSPGFYIGGQLLLWIMVVSGFEFTETGTLLPCTRQEASLRWRQSAFVLHWIALPGYLLLPLHGFNYVLLAFYGFIANESLLLLCFAWKWANWYPGRYRQNNNITLSLSFLFLLLPGFVVIPLIQGIYFAGKAIKNLRLR